jgi:ribosomal protein S27E
MAVRYMKKLNKHLKWVRCEVCETEQQVHAGTIAYHPECEVCGESKFENIDQPTEVK